MNISFIGNINNKSYSYDWNSDRNKKLTKELVKILKDITDITDTDEYRFLFGGSLGFEQIAFNLCNYMRDSSPRYKEMDIVLELAIPFKEQSIKWQTNYSDIYNKQLNQADIIIYVDRLRGYNIKGTKVDKYNKHKFDKRNEYMIDNSDLCIFFWDCQVGEVNNAIKYANKTNTKLLIIKL